MSNAEQVGAVGRLMLLSEVDAANLDFIRAQIEEANHEPASRNEVLSQMLQAFADTLVEGGQADAEGGTS